MKLAYYGAASQGFLWLQRMIESMTPAGQWLMGGLFVATLGGALLSALWWPRLARRLTAEWNADWEWWAHPATGAVLLFLLYFLYFPVWSLFTADADAWWLFLLFGWGMDAIILIGAGMLRSAEQQINDRHRH